MHLKAAKDVSLVLLAGGEGSRMGKDCPKQYLKLASKPVFAHSLELFLAMDCFKEFVIVCEDVYQERFLSYLEGKNFHFAKPGRRRQDSVFNALEKVSKPWLAIHDAARPCIDEALVLRVLEKAYSVGGAAPGLPLSFTVKQVDEEAKVLATVDRKRFWEVQTPQVLYRPYLLEGFLKVGSQTLTDDLAFLDCALKESYLVEGSRSNIKLTYPQELAFLEQSLAFHAL